MDAISTAAAFKSFRSKAKKVCSPNQLSNDSSIGKGKWKLNLTVIPLALMVYEVVIINEVGLGQGMLIG